jgi:hypothetical protein
VVGFRRRGSMHKLFLARIMLLEVGDGFFTGGGIRTEHLWC